MKTIKSGEHRLCERDPETTRVVSEMLHELEAKGMDAVRRFSREFDGWDPASFELSAEAIEAAASGLPQEAVRDTEHCQDNVRRFAEAQLATLRPLELEIRPGVFLGHRHVPVDSAGCYVPGGLYPIFGSAHMSIIPSKVAGVRSVMACTPPVKGRGAYPATVHAMARAGADRIFVVGGVQAVALMAFGLGGAEPVDVVCGPGNKYVTEAKRQLFGRCGIDLLAGPSEVLIIADDTADPALVASDLLAQAEHDPHSGACLVCFSEAFAGKALAEVEHQMAELATRKVAEQAWRDSGIVVVADSADEAVAISDGYAPEHLEIHTADPDSFAARLANYGSLFIGEETTVAYGDNSIGTNHILPTGRAARYTGGLWVGTFLKTCTWQRMTPAASREAGAIAERQCRLEQMPGHARSCRARVKRFGGT